MPFGIPDWLTAALYQQYGPQIGLPGTGGPMYHPPSSTTTEGVPGGNGYVRSPHRRRRRRRKLLTCSDKADIAFLHGQLGSGQLGRAAISALLSRRC